jgi:hypothetical protein
MREAPVGSLASAQGTGNEDPLAEKAFGNLPHVLGYPWQSMKIRGPVVLPCFALENGIEYYILPITQGDRPCP